MAISFVRLRDLVRLRGGAWLSVVVGALASLGGSSAFAASGYLLNGYPTGFAKQAAGGYVELTSALSNSPGSRVWQAAMLGDVSVADAVVLAGPAGDLAVTASATVGLADAATAIAAAAFIPEAVAVGTAGMVFYSAYRIYNENGSLFRDPGASQVPGSAPWIVAPYGNNFSDSDPAALCGQIIGFVVFTGDTLTGCSVTPGWQGQIAPLQITVSNGTSFVIDAVQGNTQVMTCPASIDPTNPANDVPAGNAPGADGKCATARYNHVPISPTDAAAQVVNNPNGLQTAPDVGKYLQALKEAIGGVGTLSALTGRGVADTPVSLTGPGSQVGNPTVTTTQNPTGGGTSTTTTTPTYTYTYSPTTINYSTTTNSTTINNVTNTTTTTTTMNPPTTASSAAPDDPTGCEANPSAAGCGGAPAGQPTLYTPKTATFADALAAFRTTVQASPIGTAMGGYFNVTAGGTCPVWTQHIPYINADLTIDQYCSDFATTALALLKAAVLVVAGIAAFRVAVL